LARVKAATHGLDLGPLEPMLPEKIGTASGRIELAPERIVADLPRFEAWLARASESGLRLINRRDLRSMNSWLHNLKSLAKGERCTLQIHPLDAERRALANGARARVTTHIGEILVPVEVTDAVMPGVVSLPHGFGHAGAGVELQVATRRPGANVNHLTDDRAFAAPSGASALYGGSVEVEAARAESAPRRVSDRPAELAQHRQPLEPGRRVGARGIDLADRAGEAERDLAVELRWVLAVVHVVVLEGRHEQIVVGVHVDRAHAVARELRGERLRRDEPDLPGRRDGLVLDLPVHREHAELADLAAVEPARERVDLEDARREVRLVAARGAATRGRSLRANQATRLPPWIRLRRSAAALRRGAVKSE
jgi:hypothetical protein